MSMALIKGVSVLTASCGRVLCFVFLSCVIPGELPFVFPMLYEQR